MTFPAEAGFAFVMGLAGGLHCIGMCGGIIAALSLSAQKKDAHPEPALLRFTLYHAGRIGSYTLLGFLLGGVASVSIGSTLWIQKTIGVLTGFVILFFGLELGGFIPDILTRFKRFLLPGRLLRHAAEKKSPVSWYLVGAANGFLPCALVYAALALALRSSSAVEGAVIMFFFGIGTIPALAFASWLMGILAPARRHAFVKATAVAMVLFGFFIILRTLLMVGDNPLTHHQLPKNDVSQGEIS